MCGIAGVWKLGGLSEGDGLKAALARMAGLLAHRGPDGQGTWHDDRVGLAHTRLAIIDVEHRADQPMHDADESTVIVFNGEIYNFRELRQELEALGHVFRTHGDTESILLGYRQWGEGIVAKLRGMFALAIWDRRRRRLLLGRDRMGQKPLVYGRFGDTLVFGSEAKAVLAWPGVPRRPDLDALHRFFTYQYVPLRQTGFSGLEKLPPGHLLVIDEQGRAEERAYWTLPRPSPVRGMTQAALHDALLDRLTEAVRLRLVADVPLGAFLSGGIDSGAVVALMARCGVADIKTFTIGFDDSRFDERDHARKVAERYGTDHHEFVVRPDAMAVVPQLAWHYDQPFADSSAIPTYYLSALTRRHVTVALNGDGGDESFLGYQRYTATKLEGLLQRLPAGLKRILQRLADGKPWQGMPAGRKRTVLRLLADAARDRPTRYGKWIALFTGEDRASLYGAAMKEHASADPLQMLAPFFADCAGAPEEAGAAYVDMQTNLPDDLLVKVDIATMAHGLEGRSPFLDHELVEFAATVPAALKMRRLQTKSLLKDAVRPLLPADVVDRPKMGFGVPIELWFRNELKDFAGDVLLSRQARERGIVNPVACERLLAEHAAGTADHHYRLWALMMQELWFQSWIDGPGLPAAPAPLDID